MEHIKYTLSSNTNLRSPTIKAEKDWLEERGELFYSVGNGKPQRTGEGCWIYFIKNGELAARSKILKITQSVKNPKKTFTGEKIYSGPWGVVIDSMELANKPIKHRGFQGFRYVKADELHEFECCFN